MIIAMLACSKKAFELMQELKIKWNEAYPEDEIREVVKCRALPERNEAGSLAEITGEWFEKADALIFICAAGIAVRSIAPYIRHKSSDPAVLVIDETGKFCISLLSGHTGGANALSERAAGLLKERGTVPVITTATDREGRFAADEFAGRNHLAVTDYSLAKEISVRILQGEAIGFTSELPTEGKLPEELRAGSKMKIGILVSGRIPKTPVYEKTLQLVPKVFCVGIGCKRNTPEEKIEQAIHLCFQENHLLQDGIRCLASIDLKKQEKGIMAWCEKRKIPFFTYSAEELKRVEGEFTASEFVEEVTGVENVCERSAVLGAGEGKDPEKEDRTDCLIVRKKCYHGVTVAVAEGTGRLVF